MPLHAFASLPFSHHSLSAGPPGLPLQLVSEQTLREQNHGLKVHFEASFHVDSAVFSLLVISSFIKMQIFLHMRHVRLKTFLAIFKTPLFIEFQESSSEILTFR